MTREERVRADLEADGWRAEPLVYTHPHKPGRIPLGGDGVDGESQHDVP